MHFKAFSHLTISRHEKRATGGIQRNNHQDGQCSPTFAGKVSSVSLIPHKKSLNEKHALGSLCPVHLLDKNYHSVFGITLPDASTK